ncbi:MAG: sigma-70 family RNA polymerase sigma factor [Hydrococcus sp. RU_2_2]|nr:sigma-70 family RNA polymerase sigma factor [Hydrococcus sp. RU_2_2]NJP17824.1 sigma-70 family RNA polymerase sigma factor [Hydrococcus sp. CRU_1_1]
MTNQQFIDDKTLVMGIVRQEQAALAELYDRYASVLYAIAFKILESVQDAEEVVLDVFCQVWQTAKRDNLSQKQVDAWLFRLTRRQALERLQRLSRPEAKKVKTFPRERIHLQQRTSIDAPQEDIVIRSRRDRAIAALQQIPEAHRQILELSYYQGLTHAEIAAQMGLPVETIKTQVRQGLIELHRLLDSP